MHRLAGLAIVVLSACSELADPEPRLPCAAETTYADGATPIHEELAWDADGNPTRWKRDEGADSSLLYTARYERGVAVHEEWSGELDAQADTSVVAGHPGTTHYVRVGLPSESYTLVNTWQANDLVGWTQTYDTGGRLAATFTATDAGFVLRRCGAACSEDTYEGVRFVGDTEHYRRAILHDSDDSLLEQIERTYDDRGLVVFETNSDKAGPFQTTTTERRDDGAPLVEHTHNLRDATFDATKTYVYQCK